MIDLQGIFERLLAFFEASPTGTRAEFEAGVVTAGAATAGEAALFVDRFLEVGDWMGLIAADDFDALMAKAAAVGLEKARNGARAIYDRLVLLVDFRIFELQERLDALRPMLARIAADLPLIATGRAWIAANAPGTAEMKAAVLLSIDLGVQNLQSSKASYADAIARLEAQITALGGTPT
jgi:uncharacterized small protein (DUF1192 family)